MRVKFPLVRVSNLTTEENYTDGRSRQGTGVRVKVQASRDSGVGFTDASGRNDL
jgi:hypothetical protein